MICPAGHKPFLKIESRQQTNQIARALRSMSEESTMTQVCVKYDNREGVSDTDLHNVYTLWIYVI